MTRDLDAAQVRAFRVRAQQLDRPCGTVADTVVLDIGVQDTGPDGALWALANRGVTAPDAAELVSLWTVRGAPHRYRRADLPHVVAAAAPYPEADAAQHARRREAARGGRHPGARGARRRDCRAAAAGPGPSGQG